MGLKLAFPKVQDTEYAKYEEIQCVVWSLHPCLIACRER